MRITEGISIQEWELSETFTRASGPGGQNVNKVLQFRKWLISLRCGVVQLRSVRVVSGAIIAFRGTGLGLLLGIRTSLERWREWRLTIRMTLPKQTRTS